MTRARLLIALGALSPFFASEPAWAQLVEESLKALEGIGIEERLDAALPLDLELADESGNRVALGQYFRDGIPVILNLVYFNCPMLCNVHLDGFVTSLSNLDWTPGREFEIVTVSIDPRDDPAGALAKRKHFLAQLGTKGEDANWHFLTGAEANVRRLAEAVGFRYRYDDTKGEYVHSAGLFIATPEGRLSRTLYGVAFDAQTLRLSLVEASRGKIGSPLDQVILFCFAYDHTAGRYGPAAVKIVRAGAALTAVLLGAFLMTSWKRDIRRRRPVSMEVTS
jgi:protein SCO1/2